MRKQISAIIRKELRNAFGSPLALIFLGTFLAAVMFIVFTLETFFVRNLADIRPMFTWMPILLIFLIAALTMRQWSEEQRSGTKELLLTLPVSHWALVLGKFFATLILVEIALLLTLGLPLTISLLGNLDWGPVLGGYIAAMLLSAAYIAIGLFVSSRTDNQIVALILTVLLGGVVYIVGTSAVTDFFSGTVSEILRALGTGSRFESILRGVLDLRDLVYYLSLTGVFLTLNVLSLDSVRWSEAQTGYRNKVFLTAGLITVNLLLLNVWLYPLGGLRIDMTQDREYSLSQPTQDLVENLTEPLEITAYISENNHPLLLPLVPRIRDMLAEYEISSNGNVTTRVIDPSADQEAEIEANQAYGIRPQPFQVSDRYEASVVNAYFDILIKYGDETAVLNFSDLIQVNQTPFGIDVGLRNLEYDLTSTIRRTVFGFQDLNSVLASLEQPATLTYYITSSTIPPELEPVNVTIANVAADIEAEGNGQFSFEIVDLNDPNSGVTAAQLQEQFGIQPFSLGLFSAETFYAHMLLDTGEEIQLLYPPDDGLDTTIRTQIEAGLKRAAPGFQKIIGVWSPRPQPQQNQFGQQVAPTLSDYNTVRSQLAQEYEVRNVSLATEIPADIDFLVVLAPRALTEGELFALDQYLLRGGKVLLGFSNWVLGVDEFTGQLALQVANVQQTAAWLAHHGIVVGRELVLDSQNQPFPVTTVRDVGGVQVQQIDALDYPFFVDVRPDGMANNPALTNLAAVTVSYAQPVQIDDAKNADRSLETLLSSTDQAWLSADPSVLPNFDQFPDTGFAPSSSFDQYPLAVTIEGQFDSYFADKEIPLNDAAVFEAQLNSGGQEIIEPAPVALSKLDNSAADGRLIVGGSATFVEDNLLNLSASLSGDTSLLNLQFVQNMADWAVEDLDLLEIRSRGSQSRVLIPLEEGGERFWEILNYTIALAALLIVYFAMRRSLRREVALPEHV
ncbi:MAG: Gldg family protein, partial [Chloroflexota bacterium]